MIYKRFFLVIVLYVFAIIALSLSFAFSIGKDLTFAIIAIASLVIITILFGMWLNRTNRKLSFFFSAVRNDETSLFFPEHEGFLNEKILHKSLNDLNARLKTAKINIELQEKFYRSIMENIATGIISFSERGVVEFTNPGIRNMFGLDQISHIDRLRIIDAKLVELLQKIKSGEQKRINVKVNHKLLSLSISAQSLIIQCRTIKIVTIQDIKSELDMHEMDSWQKLIRILNHEIMNSVAPITSLSSTISGFYKSGHTQISPEYVTPRMISDTIRGLNIIEDHGKGLIHFVESYRSLTQLPKPEFIRVNLMEFFERVTILINSYIDSECDENMKRPVITTSINPDDLSIMADDKLLAQVFINIMKNSIEAFCDSEKGDKIALTGERTSDGRILLSVQDNGPGMDQETVEKIFIPFFTTKESGSGIGLSLSRQIMRIHNGNISCDSVPGMGTTVSMIF
jgi:two-component system, NtrC family, nitrogen regulation sensor histidine kinase NtrY